MSFTKAMVLTAALSAGLSSGAYASTSGIILNTLNSGTLTTNTLNNNLAAESFFATSSGIGDVELYLSEAATSTSGSVVVTIRTSSSDKPTSTIVDTIATVSESTIPTAQTLFDFYNIPVSNLTSGTEYWIEVSKNTGPISTNSYAASALVVSPGTASTAGVPPDTDYAVGTFASSAAKLMPICISNDNSCDATYTAALADSFNVPEPATLGVVGAGLAGIGWIRRRRSAVV